LTTGIMNGLNGNGTQIWSTRLGMAVEDDLARRT